MAQANQREARQNAAKQVAQKQATKATADVAPADEQAEVPMKEQIRTMFKEGKTRREIADNFDVSYQRVFALTKDMEGAGNAGRAKAIFPDTIEVKDGDKMVEQPHPFAGQTRVDVIRELYENGSEEHDIEPGKVGPIAKLLGLKYQIVFQATKAQRAGATDEDGDEEEVESADSDSDEDEDEEEEEAEADSDEDDDEDEDEDEDE